MSEGSIHLTNARRIVPVLTQENKKEWLDKAKELSQRELERELVRVEPQRVTKERIRPITEKRLEMKLLISSEAEKDLRRMQDVLSQKHKKPCSLEEVITFMAKECLERHDPVKKAERSRLVARPISNKRSLPSAISHEIVRRDESRCTFILPNGKRCPSQRWLHRHHKTPRSQGGEHSLENLTTLCATHHRHIHDSESYFRAG